MIRFSKFIWLYFTISGIVLAAGMYSLVVWGLRPSIDFTGGTLMEVKFAKPITPAAIEKEARESGIAAAGVVKSGQQSYIVRMKPERDETLTLFEDRLASVAGTLQILRKETVGPVLGKELLVKALAAAVFAILAILGYVAYAFKNIKFGVSAILALIHDLLVVLGSFSLLGHFLGVEVDTLFVTAFLTTMSFSVHDTIVVFDRIREYRHRDRSLPLDELSDRALTETMNRSVTNSMTIIFMLLSLILMGGGTIRWFVVALMIGTVSGTYSSPFIATPILLLWDRWERRHVRA